MGELGSEGACYSLSGPLRLGKKCERMIGIVQMSDATISTVLPDLVLGQ